MRPFLPTLWSNLMGQVINRDDIEIIFVDDESTDGTWNDLYSIAMMYKEYHVEVFSQRHAYQGAARNRGIKHAKGKYLYFMDADDQLVPHALLYLVSLTELTDADLIIFKWSRLGENDKGGRVENFDIAAEIESPKERLEFFVENKPVCTRACWDKLYRRSIVVENDIQFAEGLWDEESLFTTPMYLLAKKIYVYNEILYLYNMYRDGSSSQTLVKNNQDHLFDNKYVWMQTYVKCKDLGLIEENHELFEWWFYANYYIYSQQFDRSRKYHMLERDKIELLEDVKRLFPNYKNNQTLRHFRLV